MRLHPFLKKQVTVRPTEPAGEKLRSVWEGL